MKNKPCVHKFLRSLVKGLACAAGSVSLLVSAMADAQSASSVTAGTATYVSPSAPGDLIQNAGAKLFTNIAGSPSDTTYYGVSFTSQFAVKDVGGPASLAPRIAWGGAIGGALSMYIDATGQAYVFNARNLYNKSPSSGALSYNGNASNAYLMVQQSSAPELALAVKVGAVLPSSCGAIMAPASFGWYLTSTGNLYRTSLPWGCYGYTVGNPSTGNVSAQSLMTNVSDVIQYNPYFVLAQKTNGDIYVINNSGSALKVTGADWNSLKNNTGYYYRPGESSSYFIFKTASGTWTALDVSTNNFLFSGISDASFLGRINLEATSLPQASSQGQTNLFWWSSTNTITDNAGNTYSGINQTDVQKILGFVGVNASSTYLTSGSTFRSRGALAYINQANQVVVHAFQAGGSAGSVPADLIVNFSGNTTVTPANISAIAVNGLEANTSNINGGVYAGLRLADMSGTVYQVALDNSTGAWVTNSSPSAGFAKLYPGGNFVVSSMDNQVYAATSGLSSIAGIGKAVYQYTSTAIVVAASDAEFKNAIDPNNKKAILYGASNTPLKVDGAAGTLTPTQNVTMQYLDQPLTPSASLSSYSYTSNGASFNGVWSLNPYTAQAQGLDNNGAVYGWGYLTHTVTGIYNSGTMYYPPYGSMTNTGFRDPQPLVFGAAEAKVAGFVATKGTYNDKIALNWTAYPGATQYTVTNNSTNGAPKTWSVASNLTSFTASTVLGTAGTAVAPNVGTRFMISASFNHPVYNFSSSTPLTGSTGNAGLTNTTASQCSTDERSDPACGWLASAPTDAVANATIAANSAMTDVPVTVTDPDNPNDVFTYTVLSQPQHGSAQTANSGAKLQYRPNANYVGADSFTFRVTDKAGNSLASAANITVNCPAPVISSVVMPTNPVGYSTSVITIQYTSNSCNGTLTAKFGATDAATNLSVDSLAQSYNLTSDGTAASATFVLTNPAPATLKTSISLQSAAFPANVTTSNGSLTIAGYGNFALQLNKSIATEDDLVNASVSQTAQTCTIMTEADARTNHQCFVHWTTNPLLSATFPTASSAQGYLLAGTNIPFAADIVKVDGYGADHVLQTVNQVITVLAGSPMTVKTVTFAKSLYRQYMDPVAVDLVRNSGYDCVMTTNPTTAQNNADQALRSCLVEFTTLPPGLVVDPAGGPGIRGRIADVSTNGHVEWRIKKVYSSLPAEVMVTGKFDIPVGPYAVTPAVGFDKANYAVNYSQAKVTPNVSNVSPTGASQCTTTASLADAQASWLAATGAPLCLVEWTAVPAGLTAGTDVTTKAPQLTGVPTNIDSKTAAYTLSYVTSSGTKIAAGSATKDLSIVTIINPSAVIAPAAGSAIDSSQAGPTYLVPNNGQLGTFVLTSGDYATTKATIVEDNTVPVVVTGITNGATKTLQLTPNKPAWYSRGVQFKLQYENMANAAQVTSSFRAVQLPSSSIKVALVPPATALVDTVPFSLTIQVGELLSGSTLSYDAVKHGPWNAYLAANVGGVMYPITQATAIDATTGKVTFDNLNYFDFAGQDIYAVAQAIPPANLTLDVPPTIQTSQPLALSFKRGLALVASATVAKATGPVPLAETLDLQISKDDAAALKSVAWQMSLDGGATWSPLAITGRGAKYTFTRGGTYLVRGLMTNVYSGIQSFTGVASVSAVELLKPALTGNDYALPGQTVVLSAAAKDGVGNTVTSFDTRWTIDKSDGSSSVLEGDTSVSLSSATTDAVTVTLAVKAKTMPANDPNSWTSVAKQVLFIVPAAPKVALSGPKTIETNRSGHFVAKITPPWPTTASTTLTVAGKWILPDGTESTDLAIDYTPMNAAVPTQTLTYRAWVVGAEEQTTVETTINTTAWVYVFPNFVLRAQVDSMYAPAYVKLIIAPATLDDSKLLVGKKLTYTWTAPEGLTFKNGASSMFTGINMPGVYDFTGSVTDDRGNRQDFTYQLVLQSMKPYVFDFNLVEILKYNRNPMSYAVKPTISGGHPKDRILSVVTKIDGEQVGKVTNKIPYMVIVPTSGDHEVEISFTSMMGATASAKRTVTVGVNQPPACKPQILALTSLTSKVIGNCADPDGRVMKYGWAVDGVVLPKALGNYTYYTLPAGASSATVTVTATDDSGESTSADITLTPR